MPTTERKHQDLFDAARAELLDVLEERAELSMEYFHTLVNQASGLGDDDFDETFDELADIVRRHREERGASGDLGAWLVGDPVE